MIFVSYNNKDWSSVEAVTNQLAERNVKLALDRSYLKPGQSATRALETTMEKSTGIIVFYGPYGVGPWQQAEIELGLTKHVKDQNFLFVPVVLPEGTEPSGFVSALIYSDLRENLLDPQELDKLASTFVTDKVVIGLEGASESEQINPYRSLLPFREEDARFFFGRANQVAKLI